MYACLITKPWLLQPQANQPSAMVKHADCLQVGAPLTDAAARADFSWEVFHPES